MVWDWLLNPTGLTPHGFCLNWAPGLIALHVVSDTIIALSYFSIPLALASFIRRRRDLEFNWILYAFLGFILACGATHFLSIVTFWVPAYGFEGLVKLVTAGMSLATAVLLWPLIPRLVALPSPAQLLRVNTELSDRIAAQERTAQLLRDSEARGRMANQELERRVAERTADLEIANARLTEALAEQVEAERAMARREAEFRASFENSPVGKALVEPTSRQIIRVNPAFAAMLGFTTEEMIDRVSIDLTWPEDRAADLEDYAAMLDGRAPTYIQEKRYMRRDGSPFWVRVSAMLAHVPESGYPLLAVADIEDIDERHKAQDALRDAKSMLERALTERTAALSQRDLLLREVYHRVKNNLQIVDSLLMMQAMQIEYLPANRALHSLRGRIYALGLVHHQLMGSTDLKTFDVAPFLEELSRNLREGSGNDAVTLVVDAPPLRVGLDFAVPLGLLVTELVTNALKHAFADGPGRINVTLRPDGDGAVVLTVDDDGKGLPKAPPPGDAKPGLGTEIIQSLVSQLEGSMITRTERGTTVEITMPMPAQS
jgi:PAS domain S-box-containing protein